MKILPLIYPSSSAPEEIKDITKPFEVKFRLKFSHFYIFSQELLTQIHSNADLLKKKGNLFIASDKDLNITKFFSILTKVANKSLLTKNLSKAYYDSLLEIYSRLPMFPLNGPNILTVAPEREGKILAQKMGWFVGNTIGPNLKRISYQSGLIVGSSEIKINRLFEECNIIDGAIASGATIISLIYSLKDKVQNFHIFSVHATTQGIGALFKVADFLKLNLTISVGHITNGLNYKFYAIVEAQPNRLQVGDLGDTIAPLYINNINNEK